jgi:uncharacterized YigZ family protein
MSMSNPQNDSYLSPAVPCQVELKVKGSRFIASIYPVSDEREAWKMISRISSVYSDATHHCYAFKWGEGDQARFRYSDAGEPSGTAGSAILSAIDHSKMTNVLIVVTRYFGGTKLGIGPLRRAYRDSARATIEKCDQQVKYHTVRFSFCVPYSSLKKVQQLLKIMKAEPVSQQFDEKAKYVVDVRKSLAEEFSKKMKHLMKGENPTLVEEKNKQ